MASTGSGMSAEQERRLREKARRGDPVFKFSKDITAYMNNNQPDAVLLYAKYFGKTSDASRAKMTEIDTKGFIVQYVDKKDDSEVKTVKVEFPTPLKERADSRAALTNLAVEAAAKLKIKYNPGPLLTSKDINHWEAPGPVKTLLVISLWVAFILYSIGPVDTLPEPIRTWRLAKGVDAGLYGAWRALATVHLVQCVVVFFMCTWFGDLPVSVAIFHSVLSLVFGAAHLQTPVTIATKQREKRLWAVGKGTYQPSKEEIEKLAKDEQEEEEDKKKGKKPKRKKLGILWF